MCDKKTNKTSAQGTKVEGTHRSSEKEGRGLQESGLRTAGEVWGCGAGRPVPRNRMGTGEVASTQSSTWRENAHFCKTEAPQRKGGMTLSRKLIQLVRG